LSLADIPSAEKAYQQTYEDGAAGGNFYAAVYGPINLILIAMSKGRLKDAMQLCETTTVRFDQLLAGQRFPPIGALHILKGCILMEENQLADAERALTQGLSLIRWTGEYRTHIKGYAALARLRSVQGDEAGMLESLNLLGEIRPECAPYARALRHRLSLNAPFADHARLEAARAWAAREAVNFNNLPDITGVDPISETRFRASINAAHVRARLAAQDSAPRPLADVHAYLNRQEKFAEARDLIGWQIEIWLLRALIYQVEGKGDDARRAMESALEASAPRGFFRLFLDEGRILRPLLESAGRLLKSADLAAYVKRLLAAMPDESAKVTAVAPTGVENLSERETDVLRLLADGQSYKEVGQNLFLSLNTVQFHVKSIYRKLAVNKRLQAVEKAREMNLI
jgi:LuxR family maltose regulon positive regulatory protein